MTYESPLPAFSRFKPHFRNLIDCTAMNPLFEKRLNIQPYLEEEKMGAHVVSSGLKPPNSSMDDSSASYK